VTQIHRLVALAVSDMEQAEEIAGTDSHSLCYFYNVTSGYWEARLPGEDEILATMNALTGEWS